MSDNYHYEDGAIHHDHKKVLHIDSVNGDDVGRLISAFFKEDAEEAEYEEAVDGEVKSQIEDGLRACSPEHLRNARKSEKDDTELIEKLKPIFYNNEEDVRLFLKEISGMKTGDITDLVNRWVTDKRISNYGYSRKGVLWEILYDAGLYAKSRQNWNRRVD